MHSLQLLPAEPALMLLQWWLTIWILTLHMVLSWHVAQGLC